MGGHGSPAARHPARVFTNASIADLVNRGAREMNYELLTILVVVTAAATFALWRRTDRPKFKLLKKKFRKALLESKPIVPKHNKPRFEHGLHEGEANFFYEFDDFADVMNWYLADDIICDHPRYRQPPQLGLSVADTQY
jgi:hypothetical protein